MLHITNGDSAAVTLRQAGLAGEVLPWRDVLHEGPVPAGRSLPELSDVRASYLAGLGWGSFEAIRADFARRDATLAESARHDEVVLWFEHDLYDQLQLLQLLDWFAGRDLGPTRLSLIEIDRFPGVEPFHGLGQLSAEQLASLFPARQTVSPAQLALGRTAWAAFTSPDPTAIEAVLAADTSALPFLAAALRRHLEQFPATDTGLTRTERQLLEVVAGGPSDPVTVFRAEQARESAPFMGDLSVWTYLADLAAGPRPLVSLVAGGRFALPQPLSAGPAAPGFAGQLLTLTSEGRQVLAGKLDWLALSGHGRWLGGVRLTSGRWRWDAIVGRLVDAGRRSGAGDAAPPANWPTD